MTALDAWWHLLNAVAAPLAVALLGSLAVRLLWPYSSGQVSVVGLTLLACIAALAAHITAWAFFGVEGTMVGHAAVVVVVALVLWIRVFLLRRR